MLCKGISIKFFVRQSSGGICYVLDTKAKNESSNRIITVYKKV
jgi:hypothetical protein